MKYKLKDIVTTLGDGIHGTPIFDESGEYYFFNGNNIENGNLVIKSDTKKVNFEEYKKYKKDLNNRTILVSINGTIGKVGIYNNEKCILGKSACYFNVKEEVNRDYIKFLLMNRNFQEYIKNYSTGTTIKNMSLKAMREFEFELPIRSIQDKVAHILNSIERKIELNTHINNNLYELANQLYQKAFSKDKSIKWKKYNLTDIANINTGYSYKSSELVENSTTGMATIKNFERTGGFKVDGFKPLNPSKKKSSQYVNKFDVLVACTDLTQNADIIGNAVLLLSKGNYENIVISMDLVKVTSKVNYIDNFMIYAILNSKEFKNYAIGYTSGTTVLHLNKNCFKEFTIKLPEKNIIQNFIKEIKPIYLKISQTMEENRKLEQLRDTLLPKLMNGEIDLDKIEI